MASKRRLTGIAAAAAVCALIASACSSSGSAGSAGGILRIGTSYPIDSLNPFVGQSDYTYMAFEYIYPQLTQYNANLQIVPDFATSWTESGNGLTWTFHTRPNAKWSDGKPLTAADAAWTINMEKKFENGPTATAAGVLAHLTGAQATSPTTLVIHYSRPVANVLAQFQGESILPEHIWKKYATGNGAALKTFANPAPIVSGGPFVLTKYTPNQIALFSRNPHWWGPKPHIQGFGLQFFQDDDAMVSALERGQVNYIGEYTPPTSVAALRQRGLVVDTRPSLSMKDFIINTNPHKTVHRELLNPLVREALEYATDRAQIVKIAWLGFAQPGSTIVAASDGQWHDPQIKPVPFDLAKANQLLDKAGLQDGAERGTDRRRPPDVLQRDLPAGRARRPATGRSRSCRPTSRKSGSPSSSRTWTTPPPPPRSPRRTTSTRPSTWRCGTGFRRWIRTSCCRWSPALSTAAGATPGSATRPTTACMTSSPRSRPSASAGR